VGVERLAVEVRRQRPHPARLAGPHEADEHDRAGAGPGPALDPGPCAVYRVHPMRSRYAATAARASSTWSPPNLRLHSSASTSATIASPTTPAAGTVHESVRSRSAWAGSLVARSTERSGFVRVGSGFMAARTRTGSPVVMPPSMPPARLVSR